MLVSFSFIVFTFDGVTGVGASSKLSSLSIAKACLLPLVAATVFFVSIVVGGLYFFDHEFLSQLANMGCIIGRCVKINYSFIPCTPVEYCELHQLTLRYGIWRRSLVRGNGWTWVGGNFAATSKRWEFLHARTIPFLC